jgi:hypothetical protein
LRTTAIGDASDDDEVASTSPIATRRSLRTTAIGDGVVDDEVAVDDW